jgi:hypothetical protein
LYLAPLRARARSCGYVLSDFTPFLLNIELKERDPAALRLLVALLRTYEDLFAGTPRPEVQVTMVGWWPDSVTDPSSWPAYLRVQASLDGHSAGVPPSWPVGLVSIDYGKVLQWSGRGPIPRAATETMATARRVATSYGVSIRVHHAPARRRVYEWLVAEGATLIGSGDLIRDRELLLPLSGERP